MAKFLRDEFLKNISITEETLTHINDYLSEREAITNVNTTDDKALLMTYIIRFDNRGYRLDDFLEVMNNYKRADSVERILFILESTISSETNNMKGDRFECFLDTKNPNGSLLRINSDDRDIADTVFNGLIEIISKCKNQHSLLRNTWSQLLLQIFGVAVGFAISLFAGSLIAPYLKIENAFAISFLFALLIFSNVWGFINQQILRFIEYLFPSIKFVRKGKNSFHWLAQVVITTVLGAFVLFIISFAYDWVRIILGQLLLK